MWQKWSLAWEGMWHTMTFDLDLYLQGYLVVTLPILSIIFICGTNSAHEGTMCYEPFPGQQVKDQGHTVDSRSGRGHPSSTDLQFLVFPKEGFFFVKANETEFYCRQKVYEWRNIIKSSKRAQDSIRNFIDWLIDWLFDWSIDWLIRWLSPMSPHRLIPVWEITHEECTYILMTKARIYDIFIANAQCDEYDQIEYTTTTNNNTDWRKSIILTKWCQLIYYRSINATGSVWIQ